MLKTSAIQIFYETKNRLNIYFQETITKLNLDAECLENYNGFFYHCEKGDEEGVKNVQDAGRKIFMNAPSLQIINHMAIKTNTCHNITISIKIQYVIWHQQIIYESLIRFFIDIIHQTHAFGVNQRNDQQAIRLIITANLVKGFAIIYKRHLEDPQLRIITKNLQTQKINPRSLIRMKVQLHSSVEKKR